MSYKVYVHTCPNGKKYVGCTTRVKPERRWGRNGESYRYNKHFYSAILKYGWTNFQHEVFEVESEEEMYRKEVELISFYHSNDPKFGYNNSVGGEHGYLGCKHSEEYRKKMSESQKEKWTDPEFREKMSEVYKEKWTDPGYREKMSEVRKGKPKPRIKISLPDGTIVEITKQNLVKWYINKGKKFEYVS